MEGTRTSLWLFLLINQLQFDPTDAGQGLPAKQTINNKAEPNLTSIDDTNYHDTDTNGTRADCLIDTEMGLIAISSAGGLIVCLLVTTVVLACQVYHIQRRVYAPRTSQSNMDLVSSTAYWGTDQPVVGVVGPCNTSVMLEEVRAESKREEARQADIQEAREEAGAEEEAMAVACDPEVSQMLSSSSRDSCPDIPRDLEDMPLVV